MQTRVLLLAVLALGCGPEPSDAERFCADLAEDYRDCWPPNDLCLDAYDQCGEDLYVSDQMCPVYPRCS